MKARLKPWRAANKFSIAYRVCAYGKTIGIIGRSKNVPWGMRNDWSCCVTEHGIMVLRGPDGLRRGDAKRWVLEHYVP